MLVSQNVRLRGKIKNSIKKDNIPTQQTPNPEAQVPDAVPP
jgi:hypothetical protein